MTSEQICDALYEQSGQLPESCQDGSDPAASQTAAKKDDPTGSTASDSLSAALLESHIFFTKGGSALDAEATAQLETLVRILDMPIFDHTCVRLVGHSDSSGGSDANYDIALKRAQRVANYIDQASRRDTAIQEASSLGETRPLPGVSATDPRNRRVAIWMKRCLP